MPKSVRSFADDIRSRSADDTRALLLARPDCARPEPADLTALAARAQTRASVQRATESLDARQLHLLEAILVVGADAAPAALDTTKKSVTAGITELWRMGLLWRSREGWTPVRAIADVLHTPAGLGPQLRELTGAAGSPAESLTQALATASDPDALIRTTLQGLSEPAHHVIEQLRWTNPRASFTSDKLRQVRQELTASGVMVAQGADDAVIPRDIGLALRGGKLFATSWSSADVHPTEVPQTQVDEAASAVIPDLLWQVDDVATFLDTVEPRVLRTEGLSVRDHRKLAVELDATTEFTAFLLELGYSAQLWASDGEIDPVWRPTNWYDEWATLPLATRWALLAVAWRDSSRAASLAGETIDGTLVNVLGRDANWPLMRARRRDVLTVLHDLPPGASPTVSEVDDLLRWQRPLRLPAGAPTRADVVLREAAWLGMVGRGALTSAARAVLDVHTSPGADLEASIPEVEPVVAALEPSLPRPAPGIMVQADLTAIAPGPLQPDAARLMRASADVESRGGATVFRFSASSVRRFLESGRSADDLLTALAQIALTPIPQPLEYLVHDVARRHGTLRVGSVGSYVRSSDASAVEALLADPTIAHLQLRRLTPDVVVSPLPATSVLDALRNAGLAPVAETSDGGVVVQTGQAPRANPPRRRTAPLTVTRLTEADAQSLAETLQQREASQTSAVTVGPRIPASDPTVTLTTLDEAAAERVPVWIGYVDAGGAIKRTLFRPQRIDGGRVTGLVGDAAKSADTSARPQTFSIHRITGVAPA